MHISGTYKTRADEMYAIQIALTLMPTKCIGCAYVMSFNKANSGLSDCAKLSILIRFVAYFSTLYSYCRPVFIKQIFHVLKFMHCDICIARRFSHNRIMNKTYLVHYLAHCDFLTCSCNHELLV